MQSNEKDKTHAKSVNKVILIGNLGKDEMKYTPSGVPVAKFSLATNEKYKDKSGEWQERTEWHNVIAWQRLAEIIGEYVKQGSRVYVEGKLQTSSLEDKQSGEKKYRTEIVAQELVLLGARGDGDSGLSRGAEKVFLSIGTRRIPMNTVRLPLKSRTGVFRFERSCVAVEGQHQTWPPEQLGHRSSIYSQASDVIQCCRSANTSSSSANVPLRALNCAKPLHRCPLDRRPVAQSAKSAVDSNC